MRLSDTELSVRAQFSGHVDAFVRARGSTPPADCTDLIAELARSEFKNVRMRGSEIVIGNQGQIVLAQRFPPTVKGGYLKISLGFRGAQSVDEVVSILRTSTAEVVTCEFSVSIRGSLDIEHVKRTCRSSGTGFSETAEGNFSAAVTLLGVHFTVNAYPVANSISIRGTYNRYLGDIGGAMESLLSSRRPSLLDALRKLLRL